ncbi:DUF1800 domain-containing protein [candidate division BRC1 bacterium HGW-BRC1-1]|jgi:uncharacterized protein (DUF1800 family)|nr:MAG: DUF1800 domain-containing protein [candidate division BRC1 bacterium HGW-BRC1-1]
MALLDPAFAHSAVQWNAQTARHLLNRAGFGVPVLAVGRLAGMKPDEALRSFVDYERYPDTLPGLPALPESEYAAIGRLGKTTMTEEERRVARQAHQKAAREAMMELQLWWVDRMTRTPRPLEEKLTLFWHGHFVTSAEKVRDPGDNAQLNMFLRANASGNFKTLVLGVARSPAMLRYLDNMRSSRQKPNENWARELLELFTLGIGNYTEDDIKAAARAFTGWTARNGEFVYEARRHDNDEKTFLGTMGALDGVDVVEAILANPACARHICTRLWRFFAYEDPEPEVIDGLAATMRASNYELKPVLRQMFASRAFYSDRALGTQIKSPAQLMVNLRTLPGVVDGDPPRVTLIAMRAMGQTLFYPPNVKGWDGGHAWINTDTLLARCNYASHLVSGVVPARPVRGKGKSATATSEPMESMEAMVAEPTRMLDAPSGQDAMSGEIPSRELARTLRSKQEARDSERMMRRAPMKARDFFAPCEGMTPDEMTDYLAAWFLGSAPDAAVRRRVALALAGGAEDRTRVAVPVAAMDEAHLRAGLQLLLSAAEFQLC